MLTFSLLAINSGVCQRPRCHIKSYQTRAYIFIYYTFKLSSDDNTEDYTSTPTVLYQPNYKNIHSFTGNLAPVVTSYFKKSFRFFFCKKLCDFVF